MQRDAQFAMRISLGVRRGHAAGEDSGLAPTHSVAIFSDAAESVIHVIAVGSASYSLRLSAKPASRHFSTATTHRLLLRRF